MTYTQLAVLGVVLVVLLDIVVLRTRLLTRRVFHPDKLATVSLVALLVTVGLADVFAISELLACLILGATLANLAPEKEEVGHRAFASFEPAILAIFFTLAGLEFDAPSLAAAGLLAVVVITARAFGKITAGWLAMKLAGAPASLRNNIGMALIPGGIWRRLSSTTSVAPCEVMPIRSALPLPWAKTAVCCYAPGRRVASRHCLSCTVMRYGPGLNIRWLHI